MAIISLVGIVVVYSVAVLVGDPHAYKRLAFIPLRDDDEPTLEKILWGIFVSGKEEG